MLPQSNDPPHAHFDNDGNQHEGRNSNEMMLGDRDVESAASVDVDVDVNYSYSNSNSYSYTSSGLGDGGDEHDGSNPYEIDHEIEIDQDHHDPPHGSTCDICLLTYEPGDIVAWSRNTDCPHYFHEDCITDWLHRKPTCCSCRRDYVVVPVPAETAKPVLRHQHQPLQSLSLSDADIETETDAPGTTATVTTATATTTTTVAAGDEHV